MLLVLLISLLGLFNNLTQGGREPFFDDRSANMARILGADDPRNWMTPII